MKTKKCLIDSVAILDTALVVCYLPIRLKGLLILQSARRLVGREKVLPRRLSAFPSLLFRSFVQQPGPLAGLRFKTVVVLHSASRTSTGIRSLFPSATIITCAPLYIESKLKQWRAITFYKTAKANSRGNISAHGSMLVEGKDVKILHLPQT